eukprot:scaffold3096_cov403-Prasinococcus_capsulatus_cf.AAC.4
MGTGSIGMSSFLICGSHNNVRSVDVVRCIAKQEDRVRTSKCRWGPDDLPVEPTVATNCPLLTWSPTYT